MSRGGPDVCRGRGQRRASRAVYLGPPSIGNPVHAYEYNEFKKGGITPIVSLHTLCSFVRVCDLIGILIFAYSKTR